MKYLKIESNKAYFIRKEADNLIWIEIDQINKDDLIFLLKQAIADDFDIDEFQEDLLANKAHQIIYKNLFQKFSDLLLNKTRFADESAALYKDALEKYSVKE